MEFFGATIVARFDGTDERLTNMMNMEHETYTIIPPELIALKDWLNKQFETIAFFDFRYTYALGEFELMGVLSDYSEAVDVVLALHSNLKKLQYSVMITAGFGSVFFTDEAFSLPAKRLLHLISGKGVYAAFSYYKQKEKQTLPYYFHSPDEDLSFANQSNGLTRERKHQLQHVLTTLQSKNKKES